MKNLQMTRMSLSKVFKLYIEIECWWFYSIQINHSKLIFIILIFCHGSSDISNKWSSPTFFMCCTLFCWYFWCPYTFFWYHFLSSATNSFSWSTQAFFVILDVLHLLVYGFLVEFTLISSGCLEHIFFLLYRLLYCSSMLVLLHFLIPFVPPIPWYCSFRFCLII